MPAPERSSAGPSRPPAHTQSLPLQALQHALLSTDARLRDGQLVDHSDRSDRGVQYVSLAYAETLADYGVTASVGSTGDSYDNALAEAVNGLYKAEIIHSRRLWPSVTAVEMATMDWVQWWNTRRLHENLDYRTPTEVEVSYTQQLTAAPAVV